MPLMQADLSEFDRDLSVRGFDWMLASLRGFAEPLSVAEFEAYGVVAVVVTTGAAEVVKVTGEPNRVPSELMPAAHT